MTDYLPEMQESFEPETEEIEPNINADSDTIEERVVEQVEEEEPPSPVQEKEEDEIPIVEPRKKLSQDEIFTTPKVKAIQPLDDDVAPMKKKKSLTQ